MVYEVAAIASLWLPVAPSRDNHQRREVPTVVATRPRIDTSRAVLLPARVSRHGPGPRTSFPAERQNQQEERRAAVGRRAECRDFLGGFERARPTPKTGAIWRRT